METQNTNQSGVVALSSALQRRGVDISELSEEARSLISAHGLAIDRLTPETVDTISDVAEIVEQETGGRVNVVDGLTTTSGKALHAVATSHGILFDAALSFDADKLMSVAREEVSERLFQKIASELPAGITTKNGHSVGDFGGAVVRPEDGLQLENDDTVEVTLPNGEIVLGEARDDLSAYVPYSFGGVTYQVNIDEAAEEQEQDFVELFPYEALVIEATADREFAMRRELTPPEVQRLMSQFRRRFQQVAEQVRTFFTNRDHNMPPVQLNYVFILENQAGVFADMERASKPVSFDGKLLGYMMPEGYQDWGAAAVLGKDDDHGILNDITTHLQKRYDDDDEPNLVKPSEFARWLNRRKDPEIRNSIGEFPIDSGDGYKVVSFGLAREILGNGFAQPSFDQGTNLADFATKLKGERFALINTGDEENYQGAGGTMALATAMLQDQAVREGFRVYFRDHPDRFNHLLKNISNKTLRGEKEGYFFNARVIWLLVRDLVVDHVDDDKVTILDRAAGISS